jgi:hypothetical protein
MLKHRERRSANKRSNFSLLLYATLKHHNEFRTRQRCRRVQAVGTPGKVNGVLPIIRNEDGVTGIGVPAEEALELRTGPLGCGSDRVSKLLVLVH